MNYENSGVGYLVVSAVTANGLLPVDDAQITVRLADSDNNEIIKVVRTDRSGKTPKIAVPTPDKNLSLSPAANIQPFTNVIVDGYKEGFYPAQYINAPVFSETVTLQQVNLIPKDEMTQIKSDETVYYESEPYDL